MEEVCDGIVIIINKCPVINLQISRGLWLTKGTLTFIYLTSPPLDVYFQCVFSGIACLGSDRTTHFPTYSSHGPYLLLLCSIQLILMGRVAGGVNKCPLCGENKKYL